MEKPSKTYIVAAKYRVTLDAETLADTDDPIASAAAMVSESLYSADVVALEGVVVKPA